MGTGTLYSEGNQTRPEADHLHLARRVRMSRQVPKFPHMSLLYYEEQAISKV
jgi:hypothetical protein